MSRATAGLRRAGATAGGLACLAAVAALAVLPAARAGAPDVSGGPEARLVAVPPAESVLVCPVPVSLVQPDVGDDQFSASPVPTESRLTAVATGGLASGATITDLAGGPTGALVGPLVAGPEAAVVSGDLPEESRVVRGTPSGSGDALTGTTASRTTAGDLRGLATGGCTAPGIEHWLVGGSTEVGASARLVVQNPGRTAATVALEAWGPSGPVVLGSQASFVVPPGQQAETLLEAVAPEQRRLALRVTADGGRVTAYVQHHSIEGLVAAGVDLVVPGATPSPAVAVAGLVSAGRPVDDPHAPRLRLLAPDAPGTAHVSVYGPDGPVRVRGGEDLVLEAGQVTEVPLGGLPAGVYTAVVDATVPVVASGTFAGEGATLPDAVIDEHPYDRAWVAGRAVDGAGGGTVALPPLASSAVVLAALPAERGPDAQAAGQSQVVLSGRAADGSESGQVTVDVPAGATVTVPAADLGADVVAVHVEPGEGADVAWSVLATADDGTSVPGTLVSVLVPPVVGAPVADVLVRRVVTVG